MWLLSRPSVRWMTSLLRRQLSTTSSPINRNSNSLSSQMMPTLTMTHLSSRILWVKLKKMEVTQPRHLICSSSSSKPSLSLLLKRNRTRTRPCNHSSSRSRSSNSNSIHLSSSQLPCCSRPCLLQTTSLNTMRLISMCIRPRLRTIRLYSPLVHSSNNLWTVPSKASSRWVRACSVVRKACWILSSSYSLLHFQETRGKPINITTSSLRATMDDKRKTRTTSLNDLLSK